MAQTQTVTDTGIQELMKLGAEIAATGVESIVGLNMATPCTAAAASTFADPADTAAHHTDGGLDIVAADTVANSTTNTADDTIEVDHVFTASGTKNMAGFHICNNDDDVTFMECCYNAVLAMENTDTNTIEAKMVLDQA